MISQFYIYICHTFPTGRLNPKGGETVPDVFVFVSSHFRFLAFWWFFNYTAISFLLLFLSISWIVFSLIFLFSSWHHKNLIRCRVSSSVPHLLHSSFLCLFLKLALIYTDMLAAIASFLFFRFYHTFFQILMVHSIKGFGRYSEIFFILFNISNYYGKVNVIEILLISHTF